MSSTGTILASVGPDAKGKVEATMRRNKIQTNVLGIFTKERRRILLAHDKETSFPQETNDPYARILLGKL
jgi:hydrogenase maturation factor